MNFKRHRPKNSRAGCLMCKSHKANHEPPLVKVKGLKTPIPIRGHVKGGEGDA